jgi:hypothetical protein
MGWSAQDQRRVARQVVGPHIEARANRAPLVPVQRSVAVQHRRFIHRAARVASMSTPQLPTVAGRAPPRRTYLGTVAPSPCAVKGAGAAAQLACVHRA